jgi:hypothetical protein
LRRRPSSLRWHTGIAVLATGESGCASDKRSCLPSNEFSFTTTLGSVSRNAERPRDRIPERPHRRASLAVNREFSGLRALLTLGFLRVTTAYAN